MNQSLNAALGFSCRSGYDRSLIGEPSNIIYCRVNFFGSEQTKISLTIDKCNEQIETIYLTVEPIEGVLDVGKLITSIESSLCQHIFIGHVLDTNDEDSIWRNWARKWSGSISYIPYNIIAERLSSGINTAKYLYRPWVTAICAGSLSGQPLLLDSLIKEFGFLVRVAEQVRKSRALIYSESESLLIPHLPKENMAGEAIELYGLNDLSNIHSVLNLLLKEGIYNITLLCDIHLLANYVKEGGGDEIMYHLSPQKSKMSNTDTFYINENNVQLDLSCWTTQSSTLVGECSRIVYINSPKNCSIDRIIKPLQSRLN